eukprot:CAMPEP_0183735360 /NCGR_PEP_ID=MMETSP0737-20130205/46407_1 /TAXON_ID=385413 /ORGANISM="Thalassiosira miniscula, Strain CCMP1093" /LENGTH=540 /DNA_ID=CAMNT_0025969081 /DNA_START=153 /DNA_END=1772 /DNA_ORIENTATION=+
MQFNSNADFPAGSLPTEQWAQAARPPVQFDSADFIPCACITTRVLIQCNDNGSGVGSGGADAQRVVVGGMAYMLKTAKGVLVRTSPTLPHMAQGGSGGGWSDSSSSDASSDFSDMDDDINIPANNIQNSNHVPVVAALPQPHGVAAATANNATGPLPPSSPQQIERAYWLRRTLRAAIYGQVRYGIVLRKLNPPIQVMLPASSEWVSVEWEETNESVAVKEMSWEHIRSQRDRLAEDPIKEVAAMQYLSKWLGEEHRRLNTMQIMQQLGGMANNFDMSAQLAGMHLSSSPMLTNDLGGFTNNGQHQQLPQAAAMALQNLSALPTPQNMLESHIMMPMDLLSDDRNLYSVMPYCTGGELFDVLEKKNRFSEVEARYWMRQILKGLSVLKKAGVSHRDLSLENLLVHDGQVLVIDMGMCLRVPYMENHPTKQRYLILPQGVCGKWHYMSPEVCKNQLPFDGPAVDLWAAGVILFLMLTGFPPWERPMLTDERFKYMSNGYLVQMLTEWQVGLSADAMDLLQRMFWLDPTDRLSLEQVCAHPW